jgi:ubiquinone biosynthesis protein
MHLRALDGARDLLRVGEIASVFARHGLGELLRRMGWAQAFERASSSLLQHGEPTPAKPPEVRLREAFEQLGPAFVKLGQMLSGRRDLLPPAWCAELARLHEDVAPVPWDDLRAQLIEDLGAEPETLFAELDPEPLAAGSIAQVHRASLRDGTAVVLKIRRPGIQETIESDLRLIRRLAQRMEEREDLAPFRPLILVRQFARVLRGELDLAREARNSERLRANLAPDSDLVVPRVFPEWTHRRLCVQEHLVGPSLGEWARTRAPGDVEGQRLATIGTTALLRMVFVDGVFHADPHPGNLLYLADGRVGLIDFGQIGFLSAPRREEFLELTLAIVERRPEEAAGVLMGWSGAFSDQDGLVADCADLMDRTRDASLDTLETGALLRDVLALVRENGLVLPADVALLIKVLITLEDVGRSLDPGFVVTSHLAPFVRRAVRRARSPLVVLPRLAGELSRFLVRLPRHLGDVRAILRRGRVPLEVEFPGLERLANRIDRSVNHLTVGMILAALILAAAVSFSSSRGPTVWGLPFFGLLGFASSLALALFWAWVTRRRL